MPDDIFDQLVDDILSGPEESEDEDSKEEGEEPKGEADNKPESHMLITTDAPTPVKSGAAADSSPRLGDSSTRMSVEGEGESGDSGIDDKGSRSSGLPVSTSSSFDHPDYVVDKTLSVISAQRVAGTEAITATSGRSAVGEKLIATLEQQLKKEIRTRAAKRGAHAVVGLTISFGTFAPGLFFAYATGTPVRLRKRGGDA